MCGRFDIQLPAEKLGKIYQADIAAILDFSPRYNVAPTQNVPMLFLGDDRRIFAPARFGLAPNWWKRKGRQLINLRRDTVEEKPFFRRQLESSRCVLPVTGFFEWRNDGESKTPFRFVPTGAETFPLACLWERDDIDGISTTTFAIVTGPPNELMAPIHDRMPIILREENLDKWLNPMTRTGDIFDIMSTYPADRMRAYEVSRAVNNPENDGPEVIRPV